MNTFNLKTSRHHYIPVYYLKEFTDTDGKFYVYDVEKKIIKPSKQSPKQIGFEWDRNVNDFYGTKTDDVETIFYQKIDDYISKQYKELIKSKKQTIITEADYYNLQHFAVSLYIRNPVFDKIIEQLITEKHDTDLGFEILNKATNQRHVDFENEILKSEHFIESFRTILPALQLYKLPDEKVKKFRLSFKPESETSKTIISDFPIVFNSSSLPSHDIFEHEFILPLSSKITLYYTNNTISFTRLEPEEFLKVQLLIIKQAKSFVASNDKSFLHHLIDTSMLIPEDYLRTTLFQRFK